MNLDKTYIDFIKELKQKIHSAKNRTILSVNRAMIELYFDIGKEIVAKQESLGWGKSVVEQMSKDLQEEFGKRSGYSSANLWRMRIFYLTYYKIPKLAQAVREIPWTHNVIIFQKCKDELEQEYYIRNTIEQGWSRDLLTFHIKNNLFEQDRKEAKELEVESAIVENIKRFLLELGYGFTFIGNQYKLTLEDSEYFIDLLFFHRKLNAFTVNDKLPKELYGVLPKPDELAKKLKIAK